MKLITTALLISSHLGAAPALQAPKIHLETYPGLEARLFAREPMIKAPTQVEVDHLGRVWVMEGQNYRKVREPKGDRIVILEDTNQDGQADKSSVFYQGRDVDAAMGMTVIGNKVVISNSPDVFVLEDTNGDGKSDSKTYLFRGSKGKQHDHSLHTVVIGPDGKWYFNMGDKAQGLKDKNGKPLKDIHGKDPFKVAQGKIYRCNADGSDLEIIAWNFRNPYELALDSFGGIWQSDNDDGGSPACRMNYVLEYGDYGYRGGPRSNGPRTGASPRPEVAHWRQNDAGIVPNLLLTGTGSPTGLCLYEGSLLPEVFHGQPVHCDHAQNIVRAYPTKIQGAGFSAKMVNILRGDVSWFRPTDVTVATDGSLFVSDWHDPASGGHRALSTHTGRIYRVAPKGHAYQPNKSVSKGTESAIAKLMNPNTDVRYQAREELMAAGAQALPALKAFYKSADSVGRARALWLIAKSEPEFLKWAAKDSDPNVRVTALRAARQNGPLLPEVLRELVNDSSAQVRRECAIALRFYDGADFASLWARLAKQHVAGDRWNVEALGIAGTGRWDACYDAYRQSGADFKSTSSHDVLWRMRSEKVLPDYVAIISDPKVALAQSLRIFRSFDAFSNVDSSLRQLLNLQHPEAVEINAYALKHMQKPSLKDAAVKQAVDTILKQKSGTESYVTLLQRFKMKEHNDQLLEMALKNSGRPLGRVSLNALYALGGGGLLDQQFAKADTVGKENIIALIGASKHEASSKVLLSRICDESISDSMRISMVKAINNTSTGARGVMPLIVKGKFPKHQEAEAIEILASCPYANVVDWAVARIAENNGGREPLSINKLIVMNGESARGRAILEQQCLVCHQVGDKGTAFGPNLSTVGNKLGRFGLYDAIINPDAGIEFNYETTRVTLKDGSQVAGFIADENDAELKLKLMGGVLHTVKKSDIKKRQLSKKSLMPSVYGKSLSPQQLADLVAYLQSLK